MQELEVAGGSFRELLPQLTSRDLHPIKGKTLCSLCEKHDVVWQRNMGDQKGG